MSICVPGYSSDPRRPKPPGCCEIPMSFDSVTIEKAADLLGYTPAALRQKIQRGDWIEGQEYHHAPDGCIYVNTAVVRPRRGKPRTPKPPYWRRRLERVAHATPSWADQDAILAIYDDAARLTIETGEKHHVDHVIPLHGKNVCGLHVAENLEAIPARENVRKGNRWS